MIDVERLIERVSKKILEEEVDCERGAVSKRVKYIGTECEDGVKGRGYGVIAEGALKFMGTPIIASYVGYMLSNEEHVIVYEADWSSATRNLSSIKILYVKGDFVVDEIKIEAKKGKNALKVKPHKEADRIVVFLVCAATGLGADYVKTVIWSIDQQMKYYMLAAALLGLPLILGAGYYVSEERK